MKDEFEVVQLKAHERPMEAADWLAKLDRGNLSSDEKRAFAEWLSQSPENKLEIKKLSSFWYGLNEPIKEIAQKIQSDVEEHSLKRAGWFQGFTSMKGVALGSLALLLVLSLTFLIPYYSRNDSNGYFFTQVGETQSIALEDGSVVHLNTSSVFEYSFDKDQRVVRLLSGEAMFEVAHDKDRPFIVYASNGLIQAVGTKFSVNLFQNSVQVTVAEGAVSVQRRAIGQSHTEKPKDVLLENNIILGQGESAEIDSQAISRKEQVSQEEMAERMSWIEGQLVFFDEDISTIINKVVRYTGIQIEIADSALQQEKITGSLKIGDVDVMLQGLEASLGVTSSWESPTLVRLSYEGQN